MADQDQKPANAVNQVAENLSLLLGGSYSPDGLAQEDAGKALQDRMYHRIAALEARRQRNIESIAKAAYEDAADGEGSSGEDTLDQDWMARFIDFAQEVGNDHMQQAWGHVLATETQKPGSASIQALECLSNMTSEDLDLWERAARITFPTGYLFKIGGRNEFDDFDVSERDVMRLQTLGLIQQSDDLSVTFYAPSKGLTFDFNGSDLIVRHPERQLFIMPAFHLTGIGLELLPLLADVPVNMDYLTALGQDLRSGGFDYRIRDGQGALIEHV